MYLPARPELFRRLAVTAGCLVIWRALEQVTVTGLTPSFIRVVLNGPGYGPPALMAIATSAPLAAYSVVAMGIAPYIYAILVMTLVQVISKSVGGMARSPEGRLTLRRYTRALALALALGQAYGFTALLQADSLVPSPLDWFSQLVIAIELTCGTMALVFLADVIDEFGLGFGQGAILLFALGPVATEVHRLAAWMAEEPSLEALYRPFAIWVATSIALVAGSAAVMSAFRRVRLEGEAGDRPDGQTDLRLMTAGILRPPIFAGAVMSIPSILASNFLAPGLSLAVWVQDHWGSDGTAFWTDAAYVAVDAFLVIGFTFFVVACDLRGSALRPPVAKVAHRLTLVAGVLLALAVSVVPPVETWLSSQAGFRIPMSGFDVVLVVAVLLAIEGAVVRSPRAAGADLAPIPQVL